MKFMLQRVISLLIVAAVTCGAWSQSFYLDGHKAVYDSRSNIWLCSVPQEVFGTNWTATVEIDSTWTNVTINGTTVMNGWRYRFANIKGGKKYPFTATTDTATLSGNITFTWLPVIELYGDINSEYSEGTVSINMRGSNRQIHDIPLDRFVDACKRMNEEYTLDLADSF